MKMNKKAVVKGFKLEDSRQNGALVIEELSDITLGELAEGYIDNSEDVEGGVYGWNGKLEIRPKFQRAFVVDGNVAWQTELINSVLNNRPTGTMYFGNAINGKKYINIDGQQRLMTLCSFINGDLTLIMNKDGKMESVNFDELPDEWQRKIKQYKPLIKICTGSEEALLNWFITINQPISELTSQELRNAAYNGIFVEVAKRIFAKTKKTAPLTVDNGEIMSETSKYYYGLYTTKLAPERQDVLEFALDWVSYRDYKDRGWSTAERIEAYMYKHRYDEDANDMLNFYKDVIDWINDIFFHNSSPKTHSQTLSKQEWARMYLEYKDMTDGFTENEKIHITERCHFLLSMGAALYSESTGIYEWVLRGEKKDEECMLHIRGFKPEDRELMYLAQDGIDPIDGKHYEKDEMEAHHIVPWRVGGPTIYDNMVMISKKNHADLDTLGFTPTELREKRDKLIKEVLMRK